MKKKRHIRRTLSILSLLTTCVTAYAVPAKPGVVTLRQADGTVIESRIIGDENFHTYLTEDGYPLIYNNGNYEYAVIDGDRLSTTGIVAVNANMRPDSHRKILAGISATSVAEYHTKAYVESRKQADDTRRYNKPYSDDRSRYMRGNFPNVGKQKALVILVEYQDVRFALPDPYDYFSRLLNEPEFSGHNATGSARDYFIESSQGQFEPEFEVYGPVLLPEDRAYYGSNTGGYNDAFAWKMITTAAEYLDDQIDFTEFDRDNDGYVDNIYVFYAGEGESGGGGYETVWPHSSEIALIDKKTKYIHDGKIIDRYACSNEMDYNVPDGVGTFCHEFSHVMGLPDFYATGYQASFTPGPYSLLDSGSYNNNSRTPPLYSAFERYCAGWLDLEVIDTKDNVVLPPIGTNKAYVIETGNPDEFYILENRQNVSWDTHLPGHGMMVWHIDYDKEAWSSNAVNNDPQHQHLDIIEADDMRDYDSYDGDTFPGSKSVTSFTDDTTPSMKTWDGKRLSMPITEIAETEDGFITFKIAGGLDATESPSQPEVTDIGSDTATIQWEGIEDATEYLVTVLSRYTNFVVGNYYKARSNGECSYTINGLSPESEYVCYVQAVGTSSTSYPSPVAIFATRATGFADTKVTACEATDITESGFTAKWLEADNAIGYALTVYTVSKGAPHQQVIGFDGGISDLPADWTSSSRSVYNMPAYAGNAVPSLRMTETGSSIETGIYADGISTVSFWHRGNGSSTTSNNIVVEGKRYDTWNTLATIPVRNAQGGHIETLDITDDPVSAIRITYAGDAKGSLALDDIEIYHGRTLVTEPTAGYDGLLTGNTCSYEVTGLMPQSDYCYTVKAIDEDGIHSTQSDPVYVTTAKGSGVETLSTDISLSNIVNVYDLTGRTVAAGRFVDIRHTLPPGIYIIKSTEVTNKIIITSNNQ